MIPKRMTTKEIILEEAGKLFMEKGFQATSTRDIAEYAGITQPNLYHHFKTKETIYIAVLKKLAKEVKVILDELVEEPSDSLDEILIRVLNFLRESHPVNFSIMSHDMTYEISEENHHHLYLNWRDSYVAPLERLFERFVKDNSLFTPQQLAIYFYSAISPYIQKENRFYKEVESEKIIHIFVYGIINE